MSGDEEELSTGGIRGIVHWSGFDPIRRRYHVKFGLVLLVMALSIGAIGIVATDTISAETQNNVESEYSGVSESERALVESWVEEYASAAEYISLSPELLANDSVETESRLNREQAQLGNEVHAIHLVEETDGGDVKVVRSSGDLNPGTRLSNTDRGWVPRRIDELRDLNTRGDGLVNETYRVGDLNLVAFASPVASSEDRYVVVEVNALSIAEEFQGSERAEGGFTEVVSTDDNRVIMTEPNGADRIGSTYSEDDEALQALANANDRRDQLNKSGVMPDVGPNDVLDEPYAVGYAPVEGTNWVVVTHGPRSSVFGFVQTISNWGLFATIAAVLLIGITGTALGYSTSRAIDRLTGKTERMREGDLDVTLATHRIDNIGRLYDGFAEMRDSLKAQIDEAESARKEAEVSRAEAMELSNHLQERAEEYSEVMQQCAAGDLTQRMEPDTENDSMDRISTEFNEMIEELEKTTGQLKSYVDEVEDAGQDVEQSATTVRHASEEVAESIQKIAVDAEDQKERLQSISETMDEIADELGELVATTDDADVSATLERIEGIANEINGIAELSEETQAETDNVSAAAEEQAAELNEVSERANDLQRYAQPLRDILDRFETEAEHEFVFSVGPTGGGTGSDSTVATDGDG